MWYDSRVERHSFAYSDGYRGLLPPLTSFPVDSKSQLLRIEMSLFKPKQNLSLSWWTHWQSLFLHFQLSDWHNCKLDSEEKNYLCFTLLVHQQAIVLFSAFRNNLEFTLPLLVSIYFIFRWFQKILPLDSYLYVAIIQRENFSFFYPISLLLINTPQLLQNLCLLSLMFDAQFSLAIYNTHPSYFQQTTFHSSNFSG